MKSINFKTVIKVKKTLMILVLLMSISLTFAQKEPETVMPLTDMEVMRHVAYLDIEGQIYENVIMTFKSITPDYIITDKYKVKVKVINKDKKPIYKKTLKNVFLYIFSNGQLLVGRKNFDQIVVQKASTTEDYIGVIREKEGVY